ncbi:hypothetical protein GYA54_01360 [Candidatus Kuenenbacteria bacterium]|nr:hypothetical protein [Candidatus Kuenenbacteria bacterium]
MNNIVSFGFKFIFVDVILDFFYWPIWWYTTGLKKAIIFCGRQIGDAWRVLALGIWLRNLFTPMYGDRSILGRLISFGVRIVILIWRLIWMAIWVVIIFSVLAIWLWAPVVAVWMLVGHIKALF